MKVNITYVDLQEEEKVDVYAKAGHPSLNELISIIENETYKEKILHVTDGEKKYQISCAHVYYVESMDDKLYVHTAKQCFQMKKRLYELESELPDYFTRISKSVILNLRRVDHYTPQLNGIMKGILQNGDEVYISRRYLKEIRSKIGGRSTC